MDIDVNNKFWKNLYSVIQHSYKIETHLNFFTWMQNSVAEVIPHDVLLSAWGDFSGSSTDNTLNYDIASNVDGVRTQSLWTRLEEVDTCIAHLHALWVNNHRQWYVLNNLDDIVSHCNFKAIFPNQLNEIHSILIYGVTDLRSQNDCLYVFLGNQKKFEVNNLALSLLIPHIDNALRKIKHLAPSNILENFSPIVNLSGLSERELEVIDWIKTGKTNQEIGMILNISQNTVKSHLKRIFQKLNVGKRAQAVALLANLKSTKFENKTLNLTQ